MAKIPTYNSKLSAQPTFTKPVAPRGLAENINLSWSSQALSGFFPSKNNS